MSAHDDYERIAEVLATEDEETIAETIDALIAERDAAQRLADLRLEDAALESVARIKAEEERDAAVALHLKAADALDRLLGERELLLTERDAAVAERDERTRLHVWACNERDAAVARADKAETALRKARFTAQDQRIGAREVRRVIERIARAALGEEQS